MREEKYQSVSQSSAIMRLRLGWNALILQNTHHHITHIILVSDDGNRKIGIFQVEVVQAATLSLE